MNLIKDLDHLRVETVHGGAALRVTLAAGKGNVIDHALCLELSELVKGIGQSRELRAVILDHGGEHFSYGASVPEHVPGEVERMLPAFHEAAGALVSLEVPILCVVRGLCLGGGLELAALADRIVCAPNAKFGQPEVQLGVFAPLGSALLPRVLPPRVAADLLITGRTIAADEALRLGLVAEIADDPGARALAWTEEYLVPRSASALRFATTAARRSWLPGFLAVLAELEGLYLDRLMKTHDAVEGVTAFLEKREPRWEHS